jgi:hypothetical protein
MKMKILLFVLFGFFFSNLYSQCLYSVNHTSGSKIINGINVNVTSTGFVDTNTVYCINTKPYFIGFKWSTGSAQNGAYSFQFDPPVKSISLNFGGVSNNAANLEIVKLYVNGVHYPILNKGKLNGCDTLADLTSDGNIIGCNNCGLSGWKETVVNGSISSITVFDSVIKGNPGGAIFSLFICDKATSEISLEEITDMTVSPNPFMDNIKVNVNFNDECIFKLYNIYGSCIFNKKFNNNIEVMTDFLPKGLYYYEILKVNGSSIKARLIKN